MIRLKKGVKISGLRPEIILGLAIIDSILSLKGYDTVVTSCNDGNHSYGSKHYSGLALDIRSKHIASDGLKKEFFKLFKSALGEEFDIILENLGETEEHYHMEYHPKN